MNGLQARVRRWAICFSTTLSIGCTRTRTVDRPVPVEVRVPYPVVQTIQRLCPLSLPLLPGRPVRGDSVACERAFGVGGVCFGPGEAARLASLLTTLSDVYTARRACEPPAHE